MLSYAYKTGVSVSQDFERGIKWQLIAYWLEPDTSYLLNAEVTRADTIIALKTYLQSIGYYDGTLDSELTDLVTDSVTRWIADGQADMLFEALSATELPAT